MVLLSEDERINDIGADLDALSTEFEKMADATADKIQAVVSAMNKNFETLTENIDYLNDIMISHHDELIILRVLVAVFGVLIVFLLSRV